MADIKWKMGGEILRRSR